MTWKTGVMTLAALAMVLVMATQSPAEQAASAPAAASQPSAAVAAQPLQATSQPIDPLEDFIQKSKHPVPWLSWGADLRLREEYFHNATTLNDSARGHSLEYERIRPRVWLTLTPIEDFELNLRLFSEPRHYAQSANKPVWTFNEAFLDIANVKWKHIGGLPLTATVGRQEFWTDGRPDFGDGWLIGDGTPLDGSRTLYFDAARLTYDAKPANTTVDLIYLNNHADSSKYMESIHDSGNPNIEQDEQGVIFYVKNKSIEKTQVDGYFIYKKDQKYLANGDSGDIYTFGTRVAGDINEHWKYRTEIAPQFGDKNEKEIEALGSNNRLSYYFNDPLNNNLRFSYEFRSGRKPGSTNTDGQFDILWGRWPQFSEIYNGWQDSLEGKPGESPNFHRFGPGWGCNPTKNLELSADYYLMFANQNTFAGSPGFSTDGKFRGQLAQFIIKYKFTEHLTGHLITEAFIPGNYYGETSEGWRDNPAVFARYELTLKW